MKEHIMRAYLFVLKTWPCLLRITRVLSADIYIVLVQLVAKMAQMSTLVC
jgi:hypothetical protein